MSNLRRINTMTGEVTTQNNTVGNGQPMRPACYIVSHEEDKMACGHLARLSAYGRFSRRPPKIECKKGLITRPGRNHYKVMISWLLSMEWD